jgi:glutamyl-tRNA synthetase
MLKMNRPVRVRFAPSPTGPLHIGGVKTALYNFLFARKYGGTFIIRIEDTDQSRFVPGAENYINETFQWLGITPDESVDKGGPHAPYRQSERKDMYLGYMMQLVDEGKAYYAFDTPEELEQMRQRLRDAKVDNQVYDSLTRSTMRNSLTLGKEKTEQLIRNGEPYVIRLKVERDEEIMLYDLIRGEVKVSSNNIDDKVLLKSDGMPTYHLANVIDDHLMEITHVIRGEEWLPSAPLHVLLYRYFGWEDTMPMFAHLPLLLKPDGNGKLSKRDADKHGYPVFPLDWNDQHTGETAIGFREQGYLPDAILNFLALLGWNSGTEQEMFTMDELIAAFSIERINKSGAKFDIEKAKWFNQQYLKKIDDNTLAKGLVELLGQKSIQCPMEKATAICGLMKERVTFPAEIWSNGTYFFEAPTAYDEKVIEKKWNSETKDILRQYSEALQKAGEFNASEALSILNEVLTRNNTVIGRVMQALRVAITGVAGGPDLIETMSVIGKEEVIIRINTALKSIK